MTTPILVTGGTGTLGRLVVPRLQDVGQTVRVLSRSSRPAADGVTYVTGDLLKGHGIDAAVEGVETVLHLAGGAKGDDVATRTLARAAARAGVRHLVFISVTAADRVPLGYYRSKAAAEKVVEGSGLPWTTLRAAQSHDLALTLIGALAKLPVMPVPGLRLQPVDADEVAARLVELTLGEPVGRVADLTGPEVRAMDDLCRAYLTATGKHRLTLPVRIPGKVGRTYRAGDNLSLQGTELGKQTWEDFLADRLPRQQ